MGSKNSLLTFHRLKNVFYRKILKNNQQINKTKYIKLFTFPTRNPIHMIFKVEKKTNNHIKINCNYITICNVVQYLIRF